MKAKYSLFVFALGLATFFTGAVFKIAHWPHAGFLLPASQLLMAVGVLLFAVKLASHPRVKAFLNQ
jgi:hypothetical protein